MKPDFSTLKLSKQNTSKKVITQNKLWFGRKEKQAKSNKIEKSIVGNSQGLREANRCSCPMLWRHKLHSYVGPEHCRVLNEYEYFLRLSYDFRRGVNVIFTAFMFSYLPTFRDTIGPTFKGPADQEHRLTLKAVNCRSHLKVGKWPPINTA